MQPSPTDHRTSNDTTCRARTRATSQAGVTDAFITLVRIRDLSHVATAWMEIEVTPIDDDPLDSTAVVSAASFDGEHAEPLGLDVGHTDDRSFWLDFFHDLRSRGLQDVSVVVAHEFRGLAEAVAAIFPTAGVVSWGSLAAITFDTHQTRDGRTLS